MSDFLLNEYEWKWMNDVSFAGDDAAGRHGDDRRHVPAAAGCRWRQQRLEWRLEYVIDLQRHHRGARKFISHTDQPVSSK